MPSIRDPEIPETVPFTEHCNRSATRRKMALGPVELVAPTPKTVELLNALDDKRQRAVDTVSQFCPHEPTAGIYPGYTAAELDDGRLERTPRSGFVRVDDLDAELKHHLNANRNPPQTERVASTKSDKALLAEAMREARATFPRSRTRRPKRQHAAL